MVRKLLLSNLSLEKIIKYLIYFNKFYRFKARINHFLSGLFISNPLKRFKSVNKFMSNKFSTYIYKTSSDMVSSDLTAVAFRVIHECLKNDLEEKYIKLLLSKLFTDIDFDVKDGNANFTSNVFFRVKRDNDPNYTIHLYKQTITRLENETQIETINWMDNTRKIYESDVNKPVKLVSNLPILENTEFNFFEQTIKRALKYATSTPEQSSN